MSILARLRDSALTAIWLEVSERTVHDRISGRLQCADAASPPAVKSAKFAETTGCPYCDGPLVRRNDDDEVVLQTRLLNLKRRPSQLAGLLRQESILHRIDGNPRS